MRDLHWHLGLRLLAFCLAGLLNLAIPAYAQDYPSRQIRIIAGAAPGGLIDLFARTFAQKLQDRTKQPVIVENNSVATGTIGADLVAKAAPDGYTLLMGHPANVTVWPILNSKLAYSPQKDFAPIALVGAAANLLLVSQNSPIRSAVELIASGQGQARYHDLRIAGDRQLGSHGNGAIQARRRH